MFRGPFYHATLRKMMATFGAIFSNIVVLRRYANGNEKERIKVPLAYGPAQKYLLRTQQDPTLGLGYAVKLPRMSFEIKRVYYDGQRKLNTIRLNTTPNPDQPNVVTRQYQGVPYKIAVELSILSKYIDDANQIVEQILPWFTPAYSVTINPIPGMNYKDDVAITLNNIALSDNYEDGWEVRRDVVWTLNFDINAMFYGPIKDKPIITTVKTDIIAAPATADLTNNQLLETLPTSGRITIVPGDPNATYEENYGYDETYEEFPEPIRYDPKTGGDVPPSVKIKPSGVNTKEKIGKAKVI
jgi:hypothetical protein